MKTMSWGTIYQKINSVRDLLQDLRSGWYNESNILKGIQIWQLFHSRNIVYYTGRINVGVWIKSWYKAMRRACYGDQQGSVEMK